MKTTIPFILAFFFSSSSAFAASYTCGEFVEVDGGSDSLAEFLTESVPEYFQMTGVERDSKLDRNFRAHRRLTLFKDLATFRHDAHNGSMKLNLEEHETLHWGEANVPLFKITKHLDKADVPVFAVFANRMAVLMSQTYHQIAFCVETSVDKPTLEKVLSRMPGTVEEIIHAVRESYTGKRDDFQTHIDDCEARLRD